MDSTIAIVGALLLGICIGAVISWMVLYLMMREDTALGGQYITETQLSAKIEELIVSMNERKGNIDDDLRRACYIDRVSTLESILKVLRHGSRSDGINYLDRLKLP